MALDLNYKPNILVIQQVWKRMSGFLGEKREWAEAM